MKYTHQASYLALRRAVRTPHRRADVLVQFTSNEKSPVAGLFTTICRTEINAATPVSECKSTRLCRVTQLRATHGMPCNGTDSYRVK